MFQTALIDLRGRLPTSLSVNCAALVERDPQSLGSRQNSDREVRSTPRRRRTPRCLPNPSKL
jgi:hypothetical protein